MDILIGIISILIGPFILITGIILASREISIISEVFSASVQKLQSLIKKSVKAK